MILLDVNVVLAAHRDDHPHHDLVWDWFTAILDGDEPFTVPDSVWASFIRLATSRRIFGVPTPIGDAFAFLRTVRTQPQFTPIVPTDRHLALFEALCADHDAHGDLAADAYVAALATEHGCAVASLDRDFARFESLRWLRPGE